MKIALLLLLAGCSTTVNAIRVEYQDPKATTEDLKRASYMVGCAEANLDNAKDENDVQNVMDRCRHRSMKWDPKTVGVKQ